MSGITLVEWMKTETDVVRRGIIEALYTEQTLFQFIPFETINALAYVYTTEKTLPGVAFRKLNEPFAQTHGVVQRNTETLKPYGSDSPTDKVLVDAYGNGRRASNDRMHAKSMGIKFEQTLYYGNSPASRAGVEYDDVDGFDGIQNRVTSGQTIDAGGAAGADGSSVFAIRFGDTYLTGLQVSPIDARDLGEQGSTEGPQLLTRVDHTAGVAIHHGMSVAWIKNLRATTNVLTGDMMDELADKIVGTPSLYVMSKRSRRQLKKDVSGSGPLRITLDQIGRPIVSWDGVPIVVSDAIIDTETNG